MKFLLKNRFSHILSLATAAILAAACGEEKKATGGGEILSCTSVADLCINFGTGYTAAIAEASCDALEGEFSATAACSTDDSVGSCEQTDSETSAVLTMVYSTPTWDASTAEAQCTGDDGTWTAAD